MSAPGWGSPPRGTMVDIGGRSLRLVCEGARRPGQALVVFEAGAYSGAADWGWLQPEIAATHRTCAYDRAGIGWSDPAPSGPRDPAVLAGELSRLLAAAGETGPYVLVGHSMAGLMTRAFITAHPDQVVGLVLIDAADPSAIEHPGTRVWIERYRRMAELAADAARFGLVKPLSPFFANRIGLPPGAALQEKRRMFGDPRHLAAAAREIAATTDAPVEVIAADARIGQIPVSAITAGPVDGAWTRAQQRAARLSPDGVAIAIADATHTSLLGPVHGPQVAEQIRRVLGAAEAAGR